MCDILFGLNFIFMNFFKTETVFWVFLFKSMWRGYSCSRKIWEGFKVKCISFHLRFFVLKVEIDFKELISHYSQYLFHVTSHAKTPFHTNPSLLLINPTKSISIYTTFHIFLSYKWLYIYKYFGNCLKRWSQVGYGDYSQHWLSHFFFVSGTSAAIFISSFRGLFYQGQQYIPISQQPLTANIPAVLYYAHEFINHNVNSVDPITYTLTYSIECLWKTTITTTKKNPNRIAMRGVHSFMLPS